LAFNLAGCPQNSILFESKKTALFSKTIKKGDNYGNLYSYELIMQTKNEAELQKNVQEEISKYFKVTVVKEKRMQNVYTLSYSEKLKKELTSSQTIRNTNMAKNTHQVPAKELLKILNYVFDKPVIDETSGSQEKTFLLPDNYYSMGAKEIEQLLNELGFKIAQAKRTIDVYVYKDI
jgi:hypothetical protein